MKVQQKKQSKALTKIEGGSITSVKGFKAAGVHSGLKRKRLDLGAITCAVPASAAGVFTLNQIQAAPLQVTKESLASGGKIQAVLVNSANANACTGKQGRADAYEMRTLAAKQFDIPEHQVAVTSTGVIGEMLKMAHIREGVTHLVPNEEGDQSFAEAILTTDTTTKHVCLQTEVDQQTITIGGVAKGSGMIHPNMATMLGFVTTDAAIEPDVLQQALSSITNETFNRITVDGDTSTNDMVLVLASGLAGNETLTPEHPDWENFYEGLRACCEELSKKIARDGEGATKLIEVRVQGAYDNEEAGKIAKQIVGSDLVKTAVYGTDANWGRIICAIGYSGCHINPETIDIAIGPYATLTQSEPTGASDEALSRFMQQEETIVIDVDLHLGSGEGKAWGCDLTYDYVRINAGYRT
ncbi:bifunctional glutamate N-acetyltransferase/amino-acid acetyltransferase ArgJ [Shouchella shacheensis]|uniref:bifunctional glutamate N-acetyltransferase/amino-acid acetyltransferase ArgJ n=1 Tax=Shouchella shacheensis TaxID=1649580 RepID=UPI00073FDEBF|nr:bifunctional glutamate N-acetyltransferase/amino-acid acetyltransferase ArgJ [Shouchella shacheensis]